LIRERRAIFERLSQDGAGAAPAILPAGEIWALNIARFAIVSRPTKTDIGRGPT
jgi:hypothetical protein